MLKVEYPLGSLSHDDAKARLGALGEYLHNRHGIAVSWNGDTATVHGRYMVVHIEGRLSFDAGKALFEGKDPGFLWRGKAKDYLHGKLEKYLDPRTPVDQLPRG
jgi:hypothetical protein